MGEASTEASAVQEICKHVKDFAKYEELGVETSGPNILVFKKDRNSESYPAQERLVVNTKTRTYHHLKLSVSRVEWSGRTKTREEVAVELDSTEIYFSAVADKAEGRTPRDPAEKVFLPKDVKESMYELCKWCGTAEDKWMDLAGRLEIFHEFTSLFKRLLVIEAERAKEAALQAEHKAKKQKEEEEQQQVKVVPNERVAEEMEVPCLHNEVKCPHVLKKRCFTCRKKVGMNGFNCDCEKVFCSLHQTPLRPNEDLERGHLCDFDHSNKAQEKLLEMYSKVLE